LAQATGGFFYCPEGRDENPIRGFDIIVRNDYERASAQPRRGEGKDSPSNPSLSAISTYSTVVKATTVLSTFKSLERGRDENPKRVRKNGRTAILDAIQRARRV